MSEFIENHVGGNITGRGVSDFYGRQILMDICVKCGEHFHTFVGTSERRSAKFAAKLRTKLGVLTVC